MSYVINVAKSRRTPGLGHQFAHFFRVEVDGPEERAKEVWAEIAARFPDPQFDVTVTRWENIGHEVDFGASKTPWGVFTVVGLGVDGGERFAEHVAATSPEEAEKIIGDRHGWVQIAGTVRGKVDMAL